MSTKELIRELERLPLTQRMYVIEKVMHSIREEKENEQMENAVNELEADYQNDKELTTFTSIDLDDFYESKKAL